MGSVSSAVHHAATVTLDVAAVTTFLTEVLGFERVAEYDVTGEDAAQLLAWPAAPDRTVRLQMVGNTAHGLVEVIELPQELRDVVEPGVALLSVAVRDVEGVLTSCKERGLECVGPRRVRSDTIDLTVGLVKVAGVQFELVRFEGTDAQ